MLGKFALFACVLPLLFLKCAFCDNLKIYDNLLQCYRGNRTEPWTANSLQTLVEIIRKIEDAYPTSLDIRMLSANIIHRLRIDGIERASGVPESEFITPFRPKGIMLPKFQILLKLISDVPANLNFDEVLTPAELCHLHRLISSSVEPYVRGDESRICLPEGRRTSDQPTDWIPRQIVNIINNDKVFVVSDKISRCPTETGIIRTYDYGTLSPGNVIASIAAGLQPQMVPIKELVPAIEVIKDEYENLETMGKRDTEKGIRKLLKSLDTIDNIYAASIAGDLAEVCIYQVPYYKTNVSVGTSGYWNDIDYPTVRYISENKYLNWAITDSEILGGLDGLHLANNIRPWINRIHRMRLSQILEMYYSSRGIPTYAIENANQIRVSDPEENEENHQSQRSIDDGKMARYQMHNMHEINLLSKSGFEDHFDTVRYIDTACERKYILSQIPKGKLKEQTYFLAQILQYSTSGVSVDDDLIKAACYSAVNKFLDYSFKLVDQLPECSRISGNYKRPIVDLTIIIDGSRSKTENLKLLSYLSELVDVSSFGSALSVIHGTTGQYLVKQTHSIVKAFEDLREYTGPYPTTLSLADSLAAIVYKHEAQSEAELKETQIVELTSVVLVVSQSQQIRQDDFENAKSLLEGALLQFKDMYFLFLTNDAKTFEELTADVKGKNFNEKENYKVIESADLNPRSFSKAISGALTSIPKRLTIPSCDDTRAENSEDFGKQHEFEDYLSPNLPIFYRIGGDQLIKIRELQLQFLSVGYGDLTVCKSRNPMEMQCQSTAAKDIVWFNITQPCDPEHPELCSSLTFKIEMDTSHMRCVENDCRYPDQVRFLVRPKNLDCKNNAISMIPHKLLSIFICVYIIKFLL